MSDLLDMLGNSEPRKEAPMPGTRVRYAKDPMCLWGTGTMPDGEHIFEAYVLEGQEGLVVDHTAWGTEDEMYVHTCRVESTDEMGRTFRYWARADELEILQ
jgi:hypothetical protein